MKIKVLLRALNQVLETDEQFKGRERRDALEKILRKLKTKQSRLQEKLKAASEGDTPKISRKLKTVNAHLEKAETALRELSRERSAS